MTALTLLTLERRDQPSVVGLASGLLGGLLAPPPVTAAEAGPGGPSAAALSVELLPPAGLPATLTAAVSGLLEGLSGLTGLTLLEPEGEPPTDPVEPAPPAGSGQSTDGSASPAPATPAPVTPAPSEPTPGGAGISVGVGVSIPAAPTTDQPPPGGVVTTEPSPPAEAGSAAPPDVKPATPSAASNPPPVRDVPVSPSQPTAPVEPATGTPAGEGTPAAAPSSVNGAGPVSNPTRSDGPADTPGGGASTGTPAAATGGDPADSAVPLQPAADASRVAVPAGVPDPAAGAGGTGSLLVAAEAGGAAGAVPLAEPAPEAQAAGGSDFARFAESQVAPAAGAAEYRGDAVTEPQAEPAGPVPAGELPPAVEAAVAYTRGVLAAADLVAPIDLSDVQAELAAFLDAVAAEADEAGYDYQTALQWLLDGLAGAAAFYLARCRAGDRPAPRETRPAAGAKNSYRLTLGIPWGKGRRV